MENKITASIVAAMATLYKQTISESDVQIQHTRKEFEGDFTVVVFPFVKLARKKPEQVAEELGAFVVENTAGAESFNVVKGFLNIKLAADYWTNTLAAMLETSQYGLTAEKANSPSVVIEYSSPNTNKPLHLGHIRNNFLGYSVAQVLKASGKRVRKVNLVNDRGIHICKSMIAYTKWGNNEQPTAELKGDHLVGKYYVLFDKHYKQEIETLVQGGMKKEEAEKKAPLLQEAQEMLRQWEAGDEAVNALWRKMNAWVYKGFEHTYHKMGVDFDKTYYESETYLLGKSLVQEGLEKGILLKKEDGSVWADLTEDGLDEKLLLRADGTSVYMTQDLGTAHQRYEEHKFDSHIYVVGNEQDYHFKVLALVLSKLGFNWAKGLFHLSYGMVDLPSGKMKSREGTVVDADDLIAEMEQTAAQISSELGKISNFPEEEQIETYHRIAMSALKYFILKVDPKKKMLFNPAESIDFNGNTGPFILYTYARIRSVFRKAEEQGVVFEQAQAAKHELSEKELDLVKTLSRFTSIVNEASDNYSPALVANYVYELTKQYNQFYHDHSILNAENEDEKMLRMQLSEMTSRVIKSGMNLLGIQVVERM